MKKIRRTRYKGGYYLFEKGKKTYKAYKMIKQIAQELDTPFQYVVYAVYKKIIIDGKYGISKNRHINWNEYRQLTRPHTKFDGRWKQRYYRNFILQQDRLANIERGYPIFDSYTGINERKVKTHKNNYRLTEEEASQQGLTSVFGGSIYIDPTKHLFLKVEDHYYAINMDEQIVI